MTNIYDIPDELLDVIISNLDDQLGDLAAISHVNRAFFQVVAPLLWRSIQLGCAAKGRRFFNSLVGIRPCTGELIRSVSLENILFTDRTLLILMKRTRLLTSFALDNGSRLTNDILVQLAHFWPNLQSLSLGHCRIPHTTYALIGQKCKSLTSLTLWRCPGLQANVFSTCFANARMERLTIASEFLEQQQQQKEAWKVDEATTLDLSALRTLTHLTIHGPPFGMLQYVLNQEGGVFSCWPFLRSLTLESCHNAMDDNQAIHLVQSLATPGDGDGDHHQLTHLALKEGTFRPFVLHIIAMCHPHLVSLDVSGNLRLSAHNIIDLVRRCRFLSSVALAFCGLTTLDFPEAGPHCLGDGSPAVINHLDRQAIMAIRQRA